MNPILINLYSFTPQSATGVFVYADNLIKELSRIDTARTYWIAVREDTHEYMRKTLKGRANIKYIVFGKYSMLAPRVIGRLLRNKKIAEWSLRQKLQSVIRRNKIGVAFFPSGSIYPRGLKGVRFVVTLYDIQQEYFPANFSKAHLKRRKDNFYAAENADHILAISEFTKKTLKEKYGVEDGKITVTHLASQDFPHSESMDLPKRYIFYPAAFWPHKNHHILLGAFGMIKDKFPDLHLVFTGIVKDKNILKNLETEARDRGISERVHLLGHIKLGNLYDTYKNALAMVFPSMFEGFGVPIVEAFLTGVPVIAANNTSIREVVGDAGILVPTGDVRGFADAIEELLNNQKLRTELIAKGSERAKLFSWDKTAKKTLEVFNSI